MIKFNVIIINGYSLIVLKGIFLAKMKVMKVTENKMLQLSNQMMSEENTDPHYCQECGRGLGYSLRTIKVHSSRYKGLCKTRFRGHTLYTCQYCKMDLTSQFNLNSHNRMFGKNCKALQISRNRNFKLIST